MDLYQQQLQTEIARNTGYDNIKSQYDIASKQAQTLSAGNAVANLGILITSAPKATSALSALYNVVKTPSIIKSGINDLVQSGMPTSQLNGAAARIMGLTKSLRANPELKVALQNYTASQANGGKDAMSNFVLEHQRITGKSVDFSNPNELSLASKLDNSVNNYENFIRTNRGLIGSDAEGEVNKMTARLGDMLEARVNDVVSGRAGVLDMAQGQTEGVLSRLGSRIASGLESAGTRASQFAGAIGDYATTVRNNLRGYFNLDNHPAIQSNEDFIRMTDLGDLGFSERSSLIPEEFEPSFTNFASVMNPGSMASRLPPISSSSVTTSIPPETITTGTTGTIEEPVAAAVSSVVRTPATTAAGSIGAGTASTSVGSSVAAETTSSAIAPISSTTAATTSAPSIVEDVAAVAGEAGSGILGGIGDILSLAAGPVGAIVGLGGLGYSIYQAISGAEQKPPAQPAPPPSATFNPITSVSPASSLHF